MSAVARPDLREGGQWSLAQRAKNDALWWLTRGAVATLGLLSPRALRGAGIALGAVAHRLLPGTRRLAERNVARALPELDAAARRALVSRSYRTLGGYLGDAVALLDARRPSIVLPYAEGARAVLDDALAEGHGVVFASGHLGPWESVAATLVASGIDFTAVAREPYDPRLRALYDRLRGGRGHACRASRSRSSATSRERPLVRRGSPSAFARRWWSASRPPAPLQARSSSRWRGSPRAISTPRRRASSPSRRASTMRCHSVSERFPRRGCGCTRAGGFSDML